MDKKVQKNLLITIFHALIVILILIGASFAVWEYKFTGNINNIGSDSIEIEFLESSTEVISMKNSIPISDETGMHQSDYFRFLVRTKTINEMALKYNLIIEKLQASDGFTLLNDDEVKVYLTDEKDNVLVNPTLVSDLNNYILYSKINGHNPKNEEFIDDYKLRIWIDGEVTGEGWTTDTKLQYNFKIGVKKTGNSSNSSYTVLYDANGGIGSMNNTTFITGESQNLNKNLYIKTGYSFVGWSTNPNGTVKYGDMENVLDINTSGENEITLYAIWMKKSKNINFEILYDTTKYPGPSQIYSTGQYQTISKTNSIIEYGANETITASPAYPDDRYTGSVSCTNGLTATITEGTGTTSRNDTITIANNSDTTTDSVCTITYTPKWKGIPANDYTAGSTFASSNYSNSTYDFTVKKDNGDNVGLVYNGVTGSGSYENAGTVLEQQWTNSTIVNDKNNGAILKQGNYYITTDGGISTGKTDASYWTGQGKFYNKTARNYYYTKADKYIQSSYTGRKNLSSMKQVEEFTFTSYNSTLQSVSSASKSIISSSPAKITVNGSSVTPYSVSGATITFNKAAYSYTTSDNYYSQRGRNNTFTDGNVTRINSDYQVLRWNGSSWEITTESSFSTTYRYTFYGCGGSWHGEPVVFRYKNNSEFYYAHKGAGVGWSGSSFSTSNAELREYETDDGYYVSNYASVAESNCTEGTSCTSTTITYDGTGYTRYHRTYRFDNYDNNTYCNKRRDYTTSNATDTLYYRGYFIVRER